jgi:hypothetical protein
VPSRGSSWPHVPSADPVPETRPRKAWFDPWREAEHAARAAEARGPWRALTRDACTLQWEMRKPSVKDSEESAHGALFPRTDPGKGPAALLEAAAMSDGYLALPKRRRSPADAEGQASSGKRRRVAKVDAGKHDAEQDGMPTPKSRFLGVHWNKCKKKWRVRIKIAGRDTHVGYFADEVDAALAFDRCALCPLVLLS